jgi:hypothetical protein
MGTGCERVAYGTLAPLRARLSTVGGGNLSPAQISNTTRPVAKHINSLDILGTLHRLRFNRFYHPTR